MHIFFKTKRFEQNLKKLLPLYICVYTEYGVYGSFASKNPKSSILLEGPRKRGVPWQIKTTKKIFSTVQGYLHLLSTSPDRNLRLYSDEGVNMRPSVHYADGITVTAASRQSSAKVHRTLYTRRTSTASMMTGRSLHLHQPFLDSPARVQSPTSP